VAAGDRVRFRPVENTDPREGLIERVEPRKGCICRAVRGRQHVLVANVDQLAIISSAAEPRLKPNLIDRLLVAAEKGGVRPLVCINKIDLVDPAGLQPLVGVYAQMGYEVLLLSAKTGFGVERLHRALAGRANVVAGQSGVGKSSLLNAIDPELHLHVEPVSEDNEKGKHTTTTARLLPLAGGGYVVDTPGMRQFQLWDVVPEEVGGFFRDLRPYVSLCRFPDCTHTHEDECAVKDAVADGRLDERRYESYCQLFAGDVE
jgi:ribosome biogenesis GTPase / thiamine phosphate phosphatase